MLNKEIEKIITTGIENASSDGRLLSVEELILLLLDDNLTNRCLKESNVNISNIRKNLNVALEKSSMVECTIEMADSERVSDQVKRVIQRAIFLAQSSGRQIANGIDFLDAIIQEHTSYAAVILDNEGLSISSKKLISLRKASEKHNRRGLTSVDFENINEINLESILAHLLRQYRDILPKNMRRKAIIRERFQKFIDSAITTLPDDTE